MEENKNNTVTDSEKEIFDDTVSDEILLSQIESWEKESESADSLLKKQTEVNIEYYLGNQTEVGRIKGKQSKAVENRMWMATETTVPIATSRLPEIICISNVDNEVSQMNAMNLQDALNFQMNRVKMQEKAEKFVRDIILKRYGVFKLCWNKEIDDFDVESRDPRKIRVPKFGKTIRELKYIIDYLEMSYTGVEEYFGKEKASDVLLGKDKSAELKTRKQNFIIKEVWTNDYVVWTCGRNILKKEKNPYWSEDKKERYFEQPTKPFVIKSLFELDDSIIGNTDYATQMISIQDNINIRKRQIEDVSNKVANPNLAIDSDVMSEEQAQQITNDAGQILYGKDAANPTKLSFINPGQLPQYVFEDLNESRSSFDNIWGLHSTTRGEREGRETFKGRQLLKQADLGRIDLISRQLERALTEIAEWMTHFMKLYYSEDKMFSILGEEGIKWVSVSRDNIPDVKIIIKVGSTLPKDEVGIADKALTLAQMGMIGVRTLYKMLKVPDIDSAIEDFIQTKSGAIFQQAQQTVQPQAPTPQAPVPTTTPEVGQTTNLPQM